MRTRQDTRAVTWRDLVRGDVVDRIQYNTIQYSFIDYLVGTLYLTQLGWCIYVRLRVRDVGPILARQIFLLHAFNCSNPRAGILAPVGGFRLSIIASHQNAQPSAPNRIFISKVVPG